MRQVVWLRILCLGALMALGNLSHAQGTKPSIENFRFTPTKVCMGDAVQYAFSYRNFLGGLAAVNAAEISAQRPGEPPRRAVFVLTEGERQQHTAESGSFESWTWYWPALQARAPKEGIDIQHQLKLVLSNGEAVVATETLRYEDACPLPISLANLSGGPTGRIGFETVTLTSTQFLIGAKDGKPATIWGDLRLPPGRTGRVPAVILAHGLGGVGVRETRWVEELNARGIAAFVLNSYVGRGLNTRPAVQSEFSILANVIDAYRALEMLATHPRIDPRRIALMGASRGGFIALFGSMHRFRQMHAPAGVEFAAYVALYPVCRYSFIDDEQVSDRPIRVFHGTADDQQLVAWCREYVERLRAQGKDIELTEYPGVHHLFDNPSLPPSQRLPDTPNLSRCFLVERPVGELINRESENPPSADDACRSRGVTHGYHPGAHVESVRAIKALLTKIFQLDAQ